jgi:hypothetical protein
MVRMDQISFCWRFAGFRGYTMSTGMLHGWWQVKKKKGLTERSVIDFVRGHNNVVLTILLVSSPV